jgi:hypothetical protein
MCVNTDTGMMYLIMTEIFTNAFNSTRSHRVLMSSLTIHKCCASVKRLWALKYTTGVNRVPGREKPWTNFPRTLPKASYTCNNNTCITLRNREFTSSAQKTVRNISRSRGSATDHEYTYNSLHSPLYYTELLRVHKQILLQ